MNKFLSFSITHFSLELFWVKLLLDRIYGIIRICFFFIIFLMKILLGTAGWVGHAKGTKNGILMNC